VRGAIFVLGELNMSFEELLKSISPVLKRITYKFNHRSSFFDAEDLYQEALIHLWNNFRSGRLDNKTKSYILQGCYFHLKNFLRKESPKIQLVDLDALTNTESETAYSPASDDELDTKFLIEKIQNNGLTIREKEVFSLCLSGLTVREIGSKLGISHVMVVKIKKGMRKKLEEHLE